MDSNFIYLDYNATTPVDERVLETMLPFFSQSYANPSGSHLQSLSIADSVEQYTEDMADLLGTRASNIVYTSGATEAVNLAIKGLLPAARKHILTVATEHKAVLHTCEAIAALGYQVSFLPVGADGMIDLEQLAAAITSETLLVCVMLVNNETGVIHPIRQIAAAAHRQGALLLCDATQAVGKVRIDVRDLDVDMMAFSAHKFYGPKGIGGLYCADGVRKKLSPLIHGGGQQGEARSGTLNVPGIVGMGKALSLAMAQLQADETRIGWLRDLLEDGLLQIVGTFRNGTAQHRLYNTSNICFPGVLSEQLIRDLGTISVSSGSACSAVTSRPSHVLQAMGLSDNEALSSLRFSLGRSTTEAEIRSVIDRVTQSVSKLRH